jgi:hypothetical protein
MTDVNSIFETTMKEMWNVAMKDGTITPEEKDILLQVQIDADAYSVMLQECMDDGIITKEEYEKLEFLKNQMLSRANLIAQIDDKVDEDEKALINKLVELVNIQYKLEIR